MNSTLSVNFKDEEEASGLAYMIRDLLLENVNSFKSRALVMSKLRGSVALYTSDKNRGVTLTFARGAVEIQDGVLPQTPVMESSWKVFAAVASGLASPVKSVVNKDMKVDIKPPYLSNTGLVLGTGFVLSVPKSFYENDNPKDASVISSATRDGSTGDTSTGDGSLAASNGEPRFSFDRKNRLKIFAVVAILFMICILLFKCFKFSHMKPASFSDKNRKLCSIQFHRRQEIVI